MTSLPSVNVAVDGTVLVLAHFNPAARTGIYFVLRDLVLALTRRRDVNLCLVTPSSLSQHMAGALEGSPLKIYTDPSRWRTLGVEPYAFISPHAPQQETVFELPEVTVFQIIHDLAGHVFPERDEYVLNFEIALKQSLADRGHAVCVSECTKADVLRFFEIPQERVSVICPALRSDVPYGAPGTAYEGSPYIVAMLGTGARKNFETTLEAFVKAARAAQGTGLRLLFTGIDKGEQAALVQTGVPPDLRSRVTHLGYLPDEQLPTLLGNALCLCFPSIYEGFGMPVLEAMSCGTPVIVSNAGSLPEVAGDAGIVVGAYDSTAMAAAIVRLLNDEGERALWSARGLQRAKAFSWDRSVDDLLTLIRSKIH